MADQSPSPNSPLGSQLQATLDQLERLVQQLGTDPAQGQSLTTETVARLESTLNRLQTMGGNAPGAAAPGDQGSEWDEVFVDSFPPQGRTPIKPRSPSPSTVAAPQTKQPDSLGSGATVPRPAPVPRRQKSQFGRLTAIATGLLGILVGIILWIGIPPLEVPPLWDQIASRIPPLPISRAADSQGTNSDHLPKSDQITPEDEVPAVLEAPAPPTAIAVDPLPAAPLTPEQSLLAVIQQELVDLEGLYPPQLIQRIEPNFAASRLTLTIGDNWEQLSAKQQQNLLDTLWQRAQKLSFTQLRLYAPTGDLIARSPVVGQDMVVLQSSNPWPQ